MFNFQELFAKNKILITILLLSFCVRIFLLGVSVVSNPNTKFLSDDGIVYTERAMNLIETGNLYEKTPTFLYGPGNSFFISSIFWAFRVDNNPKVTDLVLVKLIFVFLSLFTAILLYKISAFIFKDNRAALLSVALFLFSPVSILLNLKMLSETLFVFLLISSLFFYIRFLKKDKERLFDLIICSVLLGFSVYVRPIALYLPIFLIIPLFIQYFSNFRKIIKYSSLLIAVFILILSPWYYRNYKLGGTLSFSKTKGRNLLLHRAAGVLGEMKNKDPYSKEIQNNLKEKVSKRTQKDMSPLEKGDLWGKVGKEIILSHPFFYFQAAVFKGSRIFYDLGRIRIKNVLGYQDLRSETEEILLNPTNSRMDIWFYLVYSLTFIMVLYLFFILGLYYYYFKQEKEKRNNVVFLTIIIGIFYFILVSTGPEARFRFRAPLMPLLVLCSAFGLVKYSEIIWNRYCQNLSKKKWLN